MSPCLYFLQGRQSHDCLEPRHQSVGFGRGSHCNQQCGKFSTGLSHNLSQLIVSRETFSLVQSSTFNSRSCYLWVCCPFLSPMSVRCGRYLCSAHPLSAPRFLSFSAHRPIVHVPITRWGKRSGLSNLTQGLKQPASPNLPITWVDRLPAPVRPYAYLTRIDKPIGTLLLFYPCGEFLPYNCTMSSSNCLGKRGRLLWPHTRYRRQLLHR